MPKRRRRAVVTPSLACVGLVCLTLPSCGRQPPAATSGGAPRETAAASPTAALAPTQGYLKPYDFSSDWFSWNIPIWSQVLAPLKGKPGARYLEVGVYEGRSFLWALENIFTDPGARLTGIDIELPARLRANVALSGQERRISLAIGPSQLELKRLPLESYDVIYIDGSHTADDVLADAVLSFQLLRQGGILIFDDYEWDGTYLTERGPVAAPLVPRLAIDSFMAAYRYELEVVRPGYQMILRKRQNPCVPAKMKGRCSPFGQYLYDWRGGRLLLPADLTNPVPLSDTERGVIERVLVSEVAKGGDAHATEGYAALRERLHLER